MYWSAKLEENVLYFVPSSDPVFAELSHKGANQQITKKVFFSAGCRHKKDNFSLTVGTGSESLSSHMINSSV